MIVPVQPTGSARNMIGLLGMHVGDAVMIDDAQQFGFLDAIDGLRLLVVIDQDHALGACVEQIGTREVADQLALGIDDRQRTPPRQHLLHLAHQVFGMAGIKLAVHDILRAHAQVYQAHGSECVMGGADHQDAAFVAPPPGRVLKPADRR